MEINKIYNIDCFEGFKLLDDNSVDYVFTSPPYNMGVNTKYKNTKYDSYDDNIKDYGKFLSNVIDECYRVSKYCTFFNIQPLSTNRIDVYDLIGKYKDKIQNIIVWCKTNPPPSYGNNITNSYEFILIIGDNPVHANNVYTKNIITTSVNKGDKSIEHFAIMNIDVVDSVLNDYCFRGCTILDPFMGSGTTGVSCRKNHMNYIGFDISENYCMFAENRIKNTKRNKMFITK